jgi:hypothetical protein
MQPNSIQNLTQIVNKDKNQRIINGIIFLFLLMWIIAKLKYVNYASGLMVHYKYYLLKLIALLYLAQTILNKTWLNYITNSIYVILIGYVMYTYIYSYFDENDFYIQKEYGALIKTWGTFVKLSILFFILWFTIKLRPIKNNASNFRHGASPQKTLRNNDKFESK